MPKINLDKSEFTFRPIGIDGSWRCTDSRFAGTLADFLSIHELNIPEDCQFCRIIRNDDKFTYTYEFLAHPCMKVCLTLFKTKFI